jgi:hypothetical protein
MATSRLARLFGRHDDRRDDHDQRPAGTAPPAPATMAYGQRPDGRTLSGQAPPGGPVPGAGRYPSATRREYEEAARRRKAADQQVGVFERFEAKLSRQIHEATEAGRQDYVRELLSRRLSVRARLEEATVRRDRLRRREEELAAILARHEAPVARR